MWLLAGKQTYPADFADAVVADEFVFVPDADGLAHFAGRKELGQSEPYTKPSHSASDLLVLHHDSRSGDKNPKWENSVLWIEKLPRPISHPMWHYEGAGYSAPKCQATVAADSRGGSSNACRITCGIVANESFSGLSARYRARPPATSSMISVIFRSTSCATPPSLPTPNMSSNAVGLIVASVVLPFWAYTAIRQGSAVEISND
jgi:hypothetical protein